MLKGLYLRLNASLPYALGAIGHGHYLAICDTTFSVDSVCPSNLIGKAAAQRKEFVDFPNEIPPMRIEVQNAIDSAEGKGMANGCD